MRIGLVILLTLSLTFSTNNLLCLPYFNEVACANPNKVRGRVVDSNTEEPIPFANLLLSEENRGTISDVDGFFEIEITNPTTLLQVSHIGYNTQILQLENDADSITIKLERKPIDLAVVHIYPGENPALRIIRNVNRNRSANNPEAIGPFSYRSYNKIVFSAGQAPDSRVFSKENQIFRNDTLRPEHYLLIVETVSDRFFASPNKNNEVVVASRISGFSEPYLAFLATRHQSFSFYTDYVELSGEKYLSPISAGGINRYLFILEKTSFDGNDSIFVVSYRPMKGSGFNGLEGMLTINSNGWAIQSLTAEPDRSSGNSHARIRQFYQKINGQQWFPTQLDIDLEVFDLPIGPTTSIVGRGRTYLTNIDLEPDFSQRSFSPFAIDLTNIQPSQNREFWDDFRPRQLSEKEKLTYLILDSIGRKRNLDAYFRFTENLLQGRLRASFVDFFIDEFIGYTRLDGLRLGAGLVTNHLFSERVRLTGRFARGLKSNEWRTGYSTDFKILTKPDLWLGLTYSNKSKERGAPRFLDKIDFFSLDKLRALFVPKLDLVKSHELWAQVSLLRNQLQLRVFGIKETVFSIDHIFPSLLNRLLDPIQYEFFETGLMLRLAIGEGYVITPTRTFVEKKGSPIAFFTLSRGFDGVLNGNHNYLRAEARLDHSYGIKLGGVQTWSISSGLISGDGVPWSKLFTAPTAPPGIWPGPMRSFSTMGYNEFVSDKYLLLFFKHDFGRLITGSSKLWPQISFVSNFGIGTLRNENHSENAILRSFDKGFFESGLVLTDIFGLGGSSTGIQLMYRYGGHSLPTFAENFSARLFVSMPF